MNRILKLVVAFGLILLVSFPVAAAPKSLEITIEVDTLFDGDIPYPSPFVAFGPAVDAGLVCESGTVYDIGAVFAGPPDFARQNFHMYKQFVCEDGSGYFIINLKSHVVFEPYSDTGPWNIMMKGSDAYETLHGQGMLEGTPTSTGVFDVYTGWVEN